MSQAHQIRAVTYYRMSTDRQESSIAEQREAVVAYAAKHGYRILREYLDEGISGDATEKRAGFKRMLADATARGDFAVVLCWDQDRFGRFDPLEAGYWIKPLRDAGVRLETIAQGRIDWEDFAGQIIYTVQQGGKHQFLRDLSRNTTRGMLAKARVGKWLGGPPPYGYALRDGRLAPGDPAEVEVVRWLFRTYLETDISVRGLTASLNERGVPAPNGGLWNIAVVHKILTRPTYTGDPVWNRRRLGKYNAVEGGEIVRSRKRRQATEKSARQDWVVGKDPHEPLIDHDTFERVQAKLEARRDRKTPHRGAGTSCSPACCSAAIAGTRCTAAGFPPARRARATHTSATCAAGTTSAEKTAAGATPSWSAFCSTSWSGKSRGTSPTRLTSNSFGRR
jgi:site-specific DNA recombinase